MLRSRAERIADMVTFALTAVTFLLLYAPIIVSAAFSVVEVRRGRILWATFTFRHYVTLWSNASVMDALSNTAIVASCSVVLASVLAVLLAI